MNGLSVGKLLTNRMQNPLGCELHDHPRLSWVIEGDGDARGLTTRVCVALDEDFLGIVYDSGELDGIDGISFPLPLTPAPRTRYFWQVTARRGVGEAQSPVAWFETGKLAEPWAAEWIAPGFPVGWHPVLFTSFKADRPVHSARVYACGLGLFEMKLNGVKAGDDYLSPGLCAYDKWLPYLVYDVTGAIAPGENQLEIELGNGWYKGRYGLNRREKFQYGTEFALILELMICYQDGTEARIITDGSWRARRGPVVDSGIFDGETRDDTLDLSVVYPVKSAKIDKNLLEPRRSPVVREMMTLSPVEIIHTPAGETVLDMGQNMVGFFSFYCDAPRGARVHLQFGEVLQGGNFYRDNLRTAKAEFIYVSDGTPRWVRQQFTFFGFRYVKLTEWPMPVEIENFKGMVLYSDMQPAGSITTGNPLVNRLFENTLWGQRGNYLDVPTDCPQRDERMGWTGDAQVFFGTGAFNMDVCAFFDKFLNDLMKEQSALNGWVPVVVPKHDVCQVGACAWGDAATIIPWNLYVRYGDKTLLQRHYPAMRGWVEALRAQDEKTGRTRLWRGSFHYGDWLSLDVEDPIGFRFGGTERVFLASCFYLYSTRLAAKAARVLGLEADALEYEALEGEILSAILKEYLTPGGRLAVTTQTAYTLALFMDILPEEHREKAAYALRLKLKESDYHLRTGFIGTSYLCRVLSNTGSNDIAYRLLLQQDFPSWLYEVNMGATTIWERWNSVLPDGSISDTGMNSLNHYAYGSVVEWLYRDVCGINPLEEHPGFRKFLLAPKPDRLLGSASASFDSPVGRIESEWAMEGDEIRYRFRVPLCATAVLNLPGETEAELMPGEHDFTRRVPAAALTLDTPISELLKNEAASKALTETLPELPRMMLFSMMAGERSVHDYALEGFFPPDDPRLTELTRRFQAL